VGSNQSPVSRTDQLFQGLQWREYLEIGLRRKWWIVFTALAVSITVGVVALRLPNMYRSQTIIMVDAQKVPESYVSSTVSSSIADRLATIQQQVTSETRVRKLIEGMNLYPELRGYMSDQDIVKKMRKEIVVEAVTPPGAQLSAFRIAFSSRQPVVAAQVTNQLTSMFIEENLKAREQQSYGTAEFLESELQKTKKDLDAKEQQLSKIKSEYIMDLPESKQYHLQTLETLRSQLRDIQDRVSRAQQQKVFLQSIMGATPPTIDLDTSTPSSPYESEIRRLESQLGNLQGRYGPEFPDVRKVRAQLDELKAKEQESEPVDTKPVTPSTKTVRNPVLQAQLSQLDQDVAEQLKLQPSLQSQINFHVSKLEKVPIFEQRMSGLMRDYETLRTYYTHLLDKKLSADTASSLESHQKAERFVVLDPAQVPDKPFAPNRFLIALAGLLGGIFGGIGLAIIRETSDTSVRSEREVNEILGSAVLAGIPLTLNRQQIRRAKLRVTAAVVGTVVGSVVLGFAVSFMNGRLF
jgi:succinoglycan biosynthesis transport protein ExoP